MLCLAKREDSVPTSTFRLLNGNGFKATSIDAGDRSDQSVQQAMSMAMALMTHRVELFLPVQWSISSWRRLCCGQKREDSMPTQPLVSAAAMALA